MSTAFGFKLVPLSHLSVSLFIHHNLSAKNLLAADVSGVLD